MARDLPPINLGSGSNEPVRFSRNAEFKAQIPDHLAQPPSLLDAHEAVMGGHVSLEEAQELRPDYQPDKILTTYSRPRTLGDELTYRARARARGSGAFNNEAKRKRMATKRAKQKEIDNAVEDFNPS